MPQEIIKVEHLSKKFNIGTKERMTIFSSIRYKLSGEFPKREMWALQDINFSVEKGKMVAVIGPNGAGKSTLLRIISGIIKPTLGSFEVRGEVACLFELGLGFNSWFTALQNVYLYGAFHGLSRKEIDKKIPQIVEFSGLEGFMGAKLKDFSTGMRQRLAFATIIQTVEGVIIVDEVLTVGDALFQSKCIEAFENKLKQGNTILLVSHGLGRAESLCHKALYLNKGRQIAYDDFEKASEIYKKDTRQ